VRHGSACDVYLADTLKSLLICQRQEVVLPADLALDTFGTRRLERSMIRRWMGH
jgi:hypothetical protein